MLTIYETAQVPHPTTAHLWNDTGTSPENLVHGSTHGYFMVLNKLQDMLYVYNMNQMSPVNRLVFYNNL